MPAERLARKSAGSKSRKSPSTWRYRKLRVAIGHQLPIKMSARRHSLQSSVQILKEDKRNVEEKIPYVQQKTVTGNRNNFMEGCVWPRTLGPKVENDEKTFPLTKTRRPYLHKYHSRDAVRAGLCGADWEADCPTSPVAGNPPCHAGQTHHRYHRTALVPAYDSPHH